MPPLLPVDLPLLKPQFHTTSPDHAPPEPVVLNVVPPTCVMLVLSEGNGMAPENASESPDALKNDCPCAIICLKICSDVGSAGPPPQEQLICLARLSFAIRFRI